MGGQVIVICFTPLTYIHLIIVWFINTRKLYIMYCIMYCIYLYTMEAHVTDSLRNNVIDDVSV